IQGTPEVYTAWMPLMDCPSEVGGLQLAAGSHRSGVYDFHIGNGVGGIEITDPLEGRWVGGPTQAGDVIVFHSMLVHKGIPNRSERVRLSIDARFQPVSQPFNALNAESPYGTPSAWETLYDGWAKTTASEHLQRYWERYDLTFEDFDTQWFDKRDELGFALGEQGDARARSVLLRVVARDKDPAKRERAQKLLATL
ncbi:MAG: phytanoyl-CoA dioxygenase family protein, partial [Gammaproteobacteria bacterium]|nr:phytanoyl-CoA dioxygenase family protein [Gammaproteobacteria bacterium]